MEQTIKVLKEDIIEQLNLQNLKPSDIDNNSPLFVEGLGLDSIDVLELIVLFQKKYGIKIEGKEEGTKIFFSIESMAQYITTHRTK